ncbi:type-F conjugative transfer system protein TraW [Candidatus Nucleicultrix amoebiphila]|uniref:Type-F conjugative transfer system protein TraW n=1 Tax=Candidatus Nucleicultrix amoebiphila FS5 TaxID=1414854 RepID=A0A1W6N4I9_9PROT|nr:type-F conjugative transfer system protein TraW [Candidatus Nucleicultrix amoebiphila]ARN84773.1 hypothetical protein GQ61_05105 [Candidatus Nucleicultrix amoebiphila FS5]
MKKLTFCLLFLSSSVHAKDLGIQGTTFEIRERNLLEVIQTRLKGLETEGKLDDLQKDIQQRVSYKALNPTRLNSVHRTSEERSYLYDPTLIVEEDIKDHRGRIIHQKGTHINPLDMVSWGVPLVLLDGDDKEQIHWALKNHKDAKLVLIAGKPLDLSERHKKRFYFDQGGMLIKKFKIQQVPARISQKGKHLLIEEVLLEDKVQ